MCIFRVAEKERTHYTVTRSVRHRQKATMRPLHQRTLAPLAILASALLTSCSTNHTPETSTTLHIFAPASLSTAGKDLEKAFETAHTGTDLRIHYAGSTKLLHQLQEGAPADILITADTTTMDAALASIPELNQAQPTTIASNTLVLATADQNPAKISSLHDLTGNIRLALCAPQVPCGKLAQEALHRAGITPGQASHEQNVSEVSTKLATGTVDAAFIYSTDATALAKSQNITQIPLPELQPNHYPLAITHQGQQKDSAQAFATWILGEEAQAILTSYGFGTAP